MSAALAIAGPSCASRKPAAAPGAAGGIWVNDVHSQLNRTRVAKIARPASLPDLEGLVRSAARSGTPVSVCGGRHAGGGQQFLANHTLIDLSEMNRVVSFDAKRGTVDVEAGIRWPTLLEELRVYQADAIATGAPAWGIRQKQGGADELSLGGAIGANIHGRCLARRPIVRDIGGMMMVAADGSARACNRQQEADRFRHAIGGYGLFGIAAIITLRLERRQKLTRRVVEAKAVDAIELLEAARDRGSPHGDFQFYVDETSADFCQVGLLSHYEPARQDAPIVPARSAEDIAEQFRQLLVAAHVDKKAALRAYRETVLASAGVTNWSDDWQHGDYVADYHRAVDQLLHRDAPGSEILCEIYVPRGELDGFLKKAAKTIIDHDANLIYGVVRLIEKDDETVLAWAKQSYACVIFNFHTQLLASDIERNAETFRQLLDHALAVDGGYYPTYHRFARKDQTLKAFPQFAEFLKAKRRFDPRGVFRSDWFDHYEKLLA